MNTIHTPCLIVDRKQFQQNLDHMDSVGKRLKVKIRPHGKAHKCKEIAKLQQKLSSVNGICAQKLTEFKVFAETDGVDSVLLTNEVVQISKIVSILAIMEQYPQKDLIVCVDSIELAKLWNDLAQNTLVSVLLDVDCGQKRCGCLPGDAVLIAKTIQSLKHLKFRGIQAYQGANQHVRSIEDRKKVVSLSANIAKKVVDELRNEGIDCEIISGGGTGTLELEAEHNIYTEMQPGSFIFMDTDYLKNLNSKGDYDQTYGSSLFINSTIISRKSNYLILDCGLKGVATDSGMPEILNHPEFVYSSGGDEHGVVSRKDDQPISDEFSVGDTLLLRPSHCDPTVSLYNYFYWVDDIEKGTILGKVQIEASGPGI